MRHTDLPQDTPAKKLAVENCVLFLRTGSVMYGVNIPGKSDTDFVGVFMPGEDQTFGLKTLEQVEFSTNKSRKGERNTALDIDCTLYSLPKFVSLLLNNNPNTLETLFAPEHCKLYSDPVGEKILAAKDIFISKKAYHSFKGYSHSQTERLKRGEKNITGRKELVEEFGYDVKMASHALRLYLECNELLSTGKITLPLHENNLVLAVKRGQWDRLKFLEKVDELEKLCDSLYTTTKLQNSPDYEKANELVVEITKEWYGVGKNKNRSNLRKILAETFRWIADLIE